MKFLMKWATGFFVMGLIVLVSFHCPSNLKVSASNDGTIYMQAETLTEDTINQISNSSVRSQLEPGDVQVSFCIRDNPGFCGSGMGVNYDSTKYTVLMSASNPNLALLLKGDAGSNLTVIASHNNNIIGIASSGAENSEEDGIITSIFLRPRTTDLPATPVTNLNVNMLSDKDRNQYYPATESYIHILRRSG